MVLCGSPQMGITVLQNLFVLRYPRFCFFVHFFHCGANLRSFPPNFDLKPEKNKHNPNINFGVCVCVVCVRVCFIF